MPHPNLTPMPMAPMPPTLQQQQEIGLRAGSSSVRGVSRDQWGDIYANVPVKRMVALYDYDPQELSPNVDAEVSAVG